MIALGGEAGLRLEFCRQIVGWRNGFAHQDAVGGVSQADFKVRPDLRIGRPISQCGNQLQMPWMLVVGVKVRGVDTDGGDFHRQGHLAADQVAGGNQERPGARHLCRQLDAEMYRRLDGKQQRGKDGGNDPGPSPWRELVVLQQRLRLVGRRFWRGRWPSTDDGRRTFRGNDFRHWRLFRRFR